jgi:uncharacterized Zn-finger protein
MRISEKHARSASRSRARSRTRSKAKRRAERRSIQENDQLNEQRNLQDANEIIKAYKGVGELADAEYTYGKALRCDQCGGLFTKRFSLHRHLKRHTGARPHICKICQRGFAEKSTLQRHQKVHL